MNYSSDVRPSFGFDLDFVLGSPTVLHALAVALGGSVVYLSFLSRKRLASLPSPGDVIIEEQKPDKDLSRPNLQPLPRFNYALVVPEKHRPYKPKFRFTMGLQANHPNDLILLDSTYRSRLAYRRHLLRTHPETYGHLPGACWAVSEFYTYIVSHHLPTRFPQHFSKSPSGTLVLNHTTANTYPIIPQSAPNALRALGENLDEDFIILQRSDDSDGDSSWRVAAFVVCFPSGFNLGEKLGWKLREVHEPVPGLEAKLGASLERYLNKMPAGVERGVRRVNWGIARTAELFTPNGTHVYEGEEEREDAAICAEECCLRVERQTIWKLPDTGAVVFGIKTYMYPLPEIKAEEGEAERLAQAIEGLGDEMGRYKARGAWGKQVLGYLRS